MRGLAHLAFLTLILLTTPFLTAATTDDVDVSDVNWKKPGGSQPSTSGTSTSSKGGSIKLKRPLTPSSSSSDDESDAKRRKKLPDGALKCDCNGTILSQDDVKAALTLGSNYVSKGTKNGKYPEQYNNQNPGTAAREVSFPNGRCSSSNIFWYEYPVLAGGRYTGGSPGPYRAVWTLSNDFCGCIEHPSKTNPGFVACND